MLQEEISLWFILTVGSVPNPLIDRLEQGFPSHYVGQWLFVYSRVQAEEQYV